MWNKAWIKWKQHFFFSRSWMLRERIKKDDLGLTLKGGFKVKIKVTIKFHLGHPTTFVWKIFSKIILRAMTTSRFKFYWFRRPSRSYEKYDLNTMERGFQLSIGTTLKRVQGQSQGHHKIPPLEPYTFCVNKYWRKLIF